MSSTLSFGACNGVRRLSEALAVVALNGRSDSEARRARSLASGALSSGLEFRYCVL